ncbi:hypothetical protein V1505DRAFT_368384 [Lipomyces doorenjongii]
MVFAVRAQLCSIRELTGIKVQTPTQRLANQKYAKREEKKHGKPESLTGQKNAEKPPISKGWICKFYTRHCCERLYPSANIIISDVFAFMIAGGLLLEILNLILGR